MSSFYTVKKCHKHNHKQADHHKNLERKLYQNLQKVAFHCAWHVQCMYMVFVFNAMLLWMSVNVFLVVGIWKYYRCKTRAHTFL